MIVILIPKTKKCLNKANFGFVILKLEVPNIRMINIMNFISYHFDHAGNVIPGLLYQIYLRTFIYDYLVESITTIETLRNAILFSF